MNYNVETNSLKAFVLAARPKTLAGAVAPVLVGLSVVAADIHKYHYELLYKVHFLWVPAILCMLFAILMQIDANFINDYFDWKRGLDDEERLGPERACAQGWVTPRAMVRAIAITTLLAVCAGLPLIWYGGRAMLAIGVLCILFCFLYTLVLARIGLGDVLVIVFFGLIPVCTTYVIQMQGHGLRWAVIYLGLAQGLVTDLLLLVNNYRDIDTDRAHGRRTLPVMLGRTFTEVMYVVLGFAAVLLCLPLSRTHGYACIVPAIFILPHWLTWNQMVRIGRGRELNAVLGRTSLNILLFAILVSIGVWI